MAKIESDHRKYMMDDSRLRTLLLILATTQGIIAMSFFLNMASHLGLAMHIIGDLLCIAMVTLTCFDLEDVRLVGWSLVGGSLINTALFVGFILGPIV